MSEFKMRPFISYYGGKWKIAPKYPEPTHDVIVEPFAGAAGYSTRYYQKTVLLYEIDPIIADLWDYLIGVSSAEIMKIPIDVKHVDDLKGWPQAVKTLVGFWFNTASSAPKKSPSSWMKSSKGTAYWGPEIRHRIATQVDKISHWMVIQDSYTNCPDIPATWFIDPPYQVSGKYYRFSSKRIDYKHLGDFCQQRQGQVIVCENLGADWLPFEYFTDISGLKGRYKQVSKEVVWVKQ